MASSSLQAIVLAAGKGTRMKSDLPKVLHQVCGVALVSRTLYAVAALAPKRIVIVVGYGEELVRKEIEQLSAREEFSAIELECVTQGEQHGTGHAVQVGLERCSDDLDVCNHKIYLALPLLCHYIRRSS